MLKSGYVILLVVMLAMFACSSDDYDSVVGSDEQAVAISGNYTPSTAALNAAAGVTINMTYPPAWAADGSSCSRGHLPGTVKLGEYIKSAFPGVSLIGGYACRYNTANTSQTSTHGVGWALDIHIPMDNGAADNTIGDPIANWLISNAGTLGVQYLIWDRTDYLTSGTSRVATYTGPNPHVDHIHVELAQSYAANANLPIPGVPAWQGSFEFNLDSNNVYGCTDAVSLTNFTCQNRQTVYQPGQDVNVVVRIDNVRKNVIFSVQAWRLGQSSPDWTWTDPEMQVEPNVWDHAFYLPRFTNVYAGDWEMRIFANTGNGPFQLTTFHFIVPGGNQQWPGSPYQYNGNSYHCKDGVTGGENTNWIYTCNGQQGTYTEGDVVSVMTRIDNVTSSHRFRARVFHNNSHLFTTTPSNWNDVPTGQTWQYAHYWTNINVVAGTYEVRVDIDLPGGTEFEDVNVAIIQFAVNPGPPAPLYTYNGNAVLCPIDPVGGEYTNWIYTCPNSTSTFSQGQNIRVLTFIENVRHSYKFRARFYRNGSSSYEQEVLVNETTVPAGQVWSRAYTWPGLWNAPHGNWRASIEVDVGSGWQMLRSNITFSVSAPPVSYTSGSFNLCRGNYASETGANGVPQCLTPVSTQATLSPLLTYYWRLRFTGVTTSYQFRVEAYHNGVLNWSWNFGPYSPNGTGEAWFFPEFANPGPGNWQLLFFLRVGSGSFQQVDADEFFSF